MIIDLFIGEVKGDFRIQAIEVNISYDFTSFIIDKDWFDVIMLAYQKRFGGVNPKWRSINEIFVKTNLSR